MAAVDKIYGNKEEYYTLWNWCKKRNKEALGYFYDWDWDCEDWDGIHPLTNFPESIDMWLLENCDLDWVVDRIKNQYGLPQGDKK